MDMLLPRWAHVLKSSSIGEHDGDVEIPFPNPRAADRHRSVAQSVPGAVKRLEQSP